jgi:polyhydroxyalkanoate synthesis regulator phasin
MTRTWWIAGSAAVALVVALGAGTLVMAQQSNQSDGTTFLDRVAQKLGIDTPKLQDAVKSAASDEVDAAVQRGDLTQQQADKIKQGIANGKLPGFNGPLFDGHAGRGKKGFGFGFFGADLSNLAGLLGISQDQLKTELRADNATLASVAEAHGKSRDDLKNFISGEAKTQLDQAVSKGKITQQQADTMLSALQGRLDALIDRAPPFFRGKLMMPGMGAPDMPTTPATPGAGTGLDLPGRGRPYRGVSSAFFSD